MEDDYFVTDQTLSTNELLEENLTHIPINLQSPTHNIFKQDTVKAESTKRIYDSVDILDLESSSFEAETSNGIYNNVDLDMNSSSFAIGYNDLSDSEFDISGSDVSCDEGSDGSDF